MHTVKLLLTYYLNISVQAANIYQTAESNRIETFLPKLECSSSRICYVTLRWICLFSQPDVRLSLFLPGKMRDRRRIFIA